MLGGLLVTGDAGGLVSVFRVDSDNVRRIRAETHEKMPVHHLDFDGSRILTGSVSVLKLMSVSGSSRQGMFIGI